MKNSLKFNYTNFFVSSTSQLPYTQWYVNTHDFNYYFQPFISLVFRFEDPASTPSLRSPKFASAPPSLSFKGWFTFPYYSCIQRKWIISYSIAIASVKHPEWVHYIILKFITALINWHHYFVSIIIACVDFWVSI